MSEKPEEIARMERLYGTPAEDRVAFEMEKKEWTALRRSQTRGRAHDVTLYVRHKEKIAVIAKHSYAPGIFRAPSGGVHPEETMEQGIAREIMEEMGVEVELQKYVLRERVDFSHEGQLIHWTTHVLTARPLSLQLAPQDRREIREARWIPLDELTGRIGEALASSPSAGLRYRGYLHRRVLQELSRLE